jgi:hypothetical protein
MHFSIGCVEPPPCAISGRRKMMMMINHTNVCCNTFVSFQTSQQDFLPDLQKELIAVISKYVAVNPDDIKVHMERQDNLEVLEVKIELPEAAR